MNKSTMMVLLFLLATTIFGATNVIALQGAGAQNYYYNNEQTYAYHYLPSTNYGEEAGNDNIYSYNNNYYYPHPSSTPIPQSSDYPQDVTKYECQKGPFKGFFASSPEFCDTSSLTLMTWNIYQGADLSPLFNASTPTEFVTAVGSAYNRVQATNFVERADSIADEIQKTRPDLIGLQEVILLRTQIPSDGPATPATNILLDYLKILIDTLAERGLIYEPVVVQNGTDIEVPGLISTGLVDIRLTDRDVILALADNKDFTLSNTNGAQFTAKLPLTTLFGPISIPHSWVSVDVTFNKEDKVRIVSTHLEPLSPIIQSLQADELLNGPGNTRLPVVFMGDFNSNADGTGTPTYSKLKDAGFIDVWTVKGKGTGFTCCQSEDLLNPNSSLDERLDLVLFRGDFKVKDIKVVGNSQNDRTISGLWPSDHAGVVTTLKLNGNKY
jgi:endonuclease/exonuclease/phosphatase family metal-dependent hydrolase